jgi:hypothetical protein
LKTVAKDMYGELDLIVDLIDARAPTNLSLMIRFSINYWLYYYSIWSPSGHLREKEAGTAQGPPAGVYELGKPENKMRKISQDIWMMH